VRYSEDRQPNTLSVPFMKPQGIIQAMMLLRRFGHLFDLELDPKRAVDNVGHTIEIEQVIETQISRHLLSVLTSDINTGKSLRWARRETSYEWSG
jgi:hypothetical protein